MMETTLSDKRITTNILSNQYEVLDEYRLINEGTGDNIADIGMYEYRVETKLGALHGKARDVWNEYVKDYPFVGHVLKHLEVKHANLDYHKSSGYLTLLHEPKYHINKVAYYSIVFGLMPGWVQFISSYLLDHILRTKKPKNYLKD